MKYCKNCGSPVGEGKQFCNASCWNEYRGQKRRTCQECGRVIKSPKSGQKFCKRSCYLSNIKRVTSRTCARFGCYNKVGRSDSKYCSVSCSRKGSDMPRFMDFDEFISEGKPRWKTRPRSKWTRRDFWAWVHDKLIDGGHECLHPRLLDKKTLAQLRFLEKGYDNGNGRRGVGLQQMISVMEKILPRYSLYAGEFGWRKLEPGALVAYWPALEAGFISNNGDSALNLPEEGPLPSLEIPNDDAFMRGNRTSTKDWKNLPEDKWTVTTLWAFVHESLRRKRVRVGDLNKRGRKDLGKAIGEVGGLAPLIRAAQNVVGGYWQHKSAAGWHEPFTPSTLARYWKTILKNSGMERWIQDGFGMKEPPKPEDYENFFEKLKKEDNDVGDGEVRFGNW